MSAETPARSNTLSGLGGCRDGGKETGGREAREKEKTYQLRDQGRKLGSQPEGQCEGIRVIVQLTGHLLAHLEQK